MKYCDLSKFISIDAKILIVDQYLLIFANFGVDQYLKSLIQKGIYGASFDIATRYSNIISKHVV